MFSGAVKIQNQSDFIAPSQACVVALNGTRLDTKKIDAEEYVGEVQIQRQAPLKAAPDGTPVKVTLSDCLACSGCITSAEAVLLEHQSVAECRARLASRVHRVVVTLSPQTRASLAAHLGVTLLEAHGRVVSLFKALGAEVVLDASVAREIALLEAGADFVARFRAAAAAGPAAGNAALPLIASACPGWVCYAEKSVGDAAVPLLSSAMSPQAVAGVVAKRLWAQDQGCSAHSVYHVALMPCYDKKLEASREQLRLPASAATPAAPADGSAGVSGESADRVPGTDLVLTTGEILELAEGCGADLRTMPAEPLDASVSAIDASGHLWGSAGGSSGGYAEAVAAAAAAQILGMSPSEAAGPLLQWQSRGAGGSSDFREATLRGPDGTPEIRFAAVYGFRNIQTLMRQVKRGACQYHYVEVMACPSACTNGGGQIKPAQAHEAKARLAQVQDLYGSVAALPPGTHPLVSRVYGWLGGGPGSEQAREALHTEFKAVEKTAVAQLSNW